MDEKILYALREAENETCSTVAQALKSHSPRELLGIWLRYEGIYGYTDQILTVMELIGFEVCDKIDDSDFMLLDAIVED